jgi:hypothetical protein
MFLRGLNKISVRAPKKKKKKERKKEKRKRQ